MKKHITLLEFANKYFPEKKLTKRQRDFLGTLESAHWADRPTGILPTSALAGITTIQKIYEAWIAEMEKVDKEPERLAEKMLKMNLNQSVTLPFITSNKDKDDFLGYGVRWYTRVRWWFPGRIRLSEARFLGPM